MSMISELVEKLRSSTHKHDLRYGVLVDCETLFQASDTIEALSAKLAKANMELSERFYKLNEIIERLEVEADEANDNFLVFDGKGDGGNYYDGKEDGIRLAIESIKSLTENTERYYCGGWISVNDRLPHSPEDDLLVSESDYVGVGYYDIEKQKFCHMSGCSFDKPIAWMPLPEPYKPKEEPMLE